MKPLSPQEGQPLGVLTPGPAQAMTVQLLITSLSTAVPLHHIHVSVRGGISTYSALASSCHPARAIVTKSVVKRLARNVPGRLSCS